MYASRFRLLESRLEETVQQTMRSKEEKISSLEQKVEESNTVNATLLAELASVRTHIHAFKSMFLVSFLNSFLHHNIAFGFRLIRCCQLCVNKKRITTPISTS